MSNSEQSASHSQSFISGRKNEQSIMNEYKRLCMDQESFYFSIDPISYSPLPKFLPKTISKEHTHSIYLQNCTFYEMFTFAIFEHLILNPSHKKQQKIERFKKLVCSNNFLTYAGYIKGLILKGLKSMIQSAQTGISKPVAQALMGSEKMSAFCECWKEMIFYFNRKGSESEEEINSSMIELFTNFFQVEIHFITKKGKQFQKEIIGTKATDRSDVISIVLISNSFEDQEEIVSKEHSFSEISSIYGNWSYHILLSYPQISKDDHEEVQLPLSKRYSGPGKKKVIARRETIKIDYPQLFAIDEQKSQAAQSHFWQAQVSPQLIRNARQTLKKGDSLISSMKKFAQSLCSAQ